jgi:hypothetical protein
VPRRSEIILNHEALVGIAAIDVVFTFLRLPSFQVVFHKTRNKPGHPKSTLSKLSRGSWVAIDFCAANAATAILSLTG